MPLSRDERLRFIERMERDASNPEKSPKWRAKAAYYALTMRKIHKHKEAKGWWDRTPEELERLYQMNAATIPRHCRNELSYRHMVALSELYASWVLDKRLSPYQTTSLLGMSEAFRRFADEVGPDWDPEPPKKLSVLGFLGRYACDER